MDKSLDLRVLNSMADKLHPINGFDLVFKAEATLPKNRKVVAQLFAGNIVPATVNKGGVFTEDEIRMARDLISYLSD